MPNEYLDQTGTLWLWGRIKDYFLGGNGSTPGPDQPADTTNNPRMDGTKSYGTSHVLAREDHVHPTDTSRAPLASPAFTGNPTAPTQSASDDSTKLATTEFVHDVVSSMTSGVSGVKGDAESTYRTGQVNLTMADLGIMDFTGATSSAGGAHGLVPLPAPGDDDSVLWGDGDWEELAISSQAYASSVDVELQHGAGSTYDSASIPAATSSLAGVMSATDKTKLDALSDGGCWYGTSSTAGYTAAKEVTCSGFSLKKGAIIAVLFSENNTAGTPTLNVNSTGAKDIHVGNATPNSTTNVLKWSNNTLVFFMYDGTQYKYLSAVASASVAPPRGANTWYGSCHTIAATATKTATINNFVLTEGAVVILQMIQANTNANAITLNVNSTGAKTIYAYGAATSTTNKFLWGAGAVLAFVYDGTFWRVLHEDFTYGNGLVCRYINGLLDIAVDLQSTTKLTNAATAATEVANRVYPVALDSNGDLAVNVPWTDTETAISAGTGISIGTGNVINHSNSVTAGTIGNSSASSGRTISVPYATYDAQGHITAKGTHTHTIGSLQASDVTSGTFDAARIPNLDASKITSGTIDAARLPSYVDDVIEAYPVSGSTALSAGWLSKTSGGSALTPETGKIYVLMADFVGTGSAANPQYRANQEFRWGGTTYVQLNDSGCSAITTQWLEDNLT